MNSITQTTTTIEAAAKILKDPALPDVACNVLRLNRVVEDKPPGEPCPKRYYTAAQRQQGVGLHVAVAPLRAYIWARQNPVLAVGIGVGAVALIYSLGFAAGKRRFR